MANKRYLGVDYGERRIGLALADSDHRIPRTWRILEIGHAPIVDVIYGMVQAERITDIVLGLPRNLDGDDTPQTAIVRKFGHELNRLGLPVHLQDEAGTTALARERYPDREFVDDEAAAIILQDFLES